MSKKLLIGIIVAVVVVSAVGIGIWRVQAEKSRYMATLQPVLQHSASLDSDIHGILASDMTIGAQREQISTVQSEARELRRDLVSIVPPNRYKNAHESLTIAASKRMTILTCFNDFLDHMLLIEADKLLQHIKKAGDYLAVAAATGSKTYLDLSKAEIVKASSILDENKKWIDYAEGDLVACDTAIDEYLTALQRATTELDTQVASRIGDINLSVFKQGISESKKLNDNMISLVKGLQP